VDWDHLRDDLGATDEEIMEALASVNCVHNFNLITCASGGGKEAWYTYNMDDFEPEEVPEAAE
jgi:alkylhydroperoxidase/carboxymuconolactone decarboxylase family protein YurZ